jgi:hypothetical protein
MISVWVRDLKAGQRLEPNFLVRRKTPRKPEKSDPTPERGADFLFPTR